MTYKRNLFPKSLILFLILSEVIQNLQNERIINTVYSPFYLNKYDFQNKEGVPLQIKVAYDSELVFIASGFGGFIIIDQNGQNKLYQQSLGSEYIETFDVSRDGQLLIVGFKGKMNIYQSKSDSNCDDARYQIKVSIMFPTKILSIKYIEDLKIVIAGGLGGQIVAYDVSNLDEINQFAYFSTNSPQVTNIYISKDYQWIYLSCDIVGIIVLQLNIQQKQNPIKGKFILAAQGKGYRKSWSVVATHDNKYIYEIENWFGIYFANNEQVLNSKPDQFPINLQFKAYWPLKQINPVCTILLISSNDNLLFVGVRSMGILIFDISDREDIQFFQHIQVDSLSVHAALSKNESFLYYSNSLSIYTFQSSIPNLQNDFPNIFNVQQAYQREMDGIYKWRCYVDPSNQYLIGAFDYSGFYIIPFKQDPTRLQVSKAIRLDIESDSMFLDMDQKFLFIPRLYGEQLVNVYSIAPTKDFQDISLTNPKYVSSFNINTTQMAEQLIFGKDKKYAIQTYQTGMMLFNMTNPLEIKLLCYWPSPEIMTGETGGGAITDDNNWIIGMVRNYGIYVLDAKNKTNLVLANYMETLGAESITLSKILPDFAYICDGNRGFAIMNLSSLPKINIISKILLPGWTQLSIPIRGDNFILVCQQDNGMLTLIDIRDKYHPKVISTYRRDKQFAVSICTTTDEKYVFITTQIGIISLPLFSKVMIHTEVSQITISQLTGLKTITAFQKNQNQNEFIFQVGQVIQLNFVILYPEDEDMKIIYIKSYESNQILDIPYYMKYDLNSQTLIINADKQALGDKRDTNLNIILIKTVIPLSKNSFIYMSSDDSDFAITNEQQADYIIKYLMNRNYLDSKKIISEYFDPSKEFQFDDSFSQSFQKDFSSKIKNYDTFFKQLEEKVKITLMQSSFINPFKFQVQASIYFDFDNSINFITSLSTQFISVFLQIQSGGKFATKEYSGVITSTSFLGDQIKIEGSLANVNRVLQQMIIFAQDLSLSEPEISKIDVIITIIDNNNYPLIITKSIIDCKFIVLKKKLQVKIPLQQQIQKQYEGSIVDIESEISFSFSQKSFYVADSEKIVYKIQVQSSSSNNESDSYIDLPPDFWLQSQNIQQLNFYGKIPQKMFKESFRFKIIANDGYTKAEDYFKLDAYGVPLLYIINNLLKILGPILFVIGIYGKRYIILNIIYKKSIIFEDEISYCGEIYIKRIVFLGKVIEDSKQIVNHLIKKVNTEKVQKENNSICLDIDKMKEHEIKLNQQQSQNQTQKIEEAQIDIFQSQILNNDNNNLVNSQIESQQSPRNSINLNVSNHLKQSPKKSNYRNIKENINNSYQFKTHMNNICQSQSLSYSINYGINNEGSFLHSQSPLQNKFIRKYQKKLTKQSYYNQSSLAEKLFLKQTEGICMQQVVESILKYNLTFGFDSPLKGSVDYTEDLKNIHSRIYRAVKAQIARYFLFLDKNSQIVYNCIKQYCLQNLKKNQNSWYRGVVYIIPTENCKENRKEIIFPQVELNYKVIVEILIHLQILVKKVYQINSIDQLYNTLKSQKKRTNIFLIKEVIIADAFGLLSDSPTCLRPVQGESIHLHPYEIKSIQAYKKVNVNKFYLFFLSLINLDYKRYGVSENMRLPTWLTLDQKYGVILFKGTPSTLDVEEVLIRIYDEDGYIVMQFILKIMPQQSKIHKQDTDFTIPDEDEQINNAVEFPQSKIRQIKSLLSQKKCY